MSRSNLKSENDNIPIYVMNYEAVILNPMEWLPTIIKFSASADEDALVVCQSMAVDCAIDLWEKTRFIGHLEPQLP